MRRITKYKIVFTVICMLGLILIILLGGAKTEIESSNEKTPYTPEHTFNVQSSLVFEAVVLKTDGTSLYVRPTRLWKGDESDIETRLGLAKECVGYFKAGTRYLFLLPNKAGGSYGVQPCQLRSIKLPTDADLSFLKGHKYKDLNY